MMENKRMRINPLEEGLWLLDDAGESTCYVLCGTERAMVIDTVNGEENLLEIVRTLTGLPLIVVNTHGHCDHIWGNVYFDEAWMHPADNALAAAHFAMREGGAAPCPFRPLEIGQRIDLGGEEVEIVGLPGHTPGSIGVLDRKRRLLFSGDGLNPHIWMQLEESLPISTLRDTILTLKADHGADFDRLLTGHARDYTPAALLDEMLRACEELLRGEGHDDAPYHWFGDVCRQHRYDDNPDHVIVYREECVR